MKKIAIVAAALALAGCAALGQGAAVPLVREQASRDLETDLAVTLLPMKGSRPEILNEAAQDTVIRAKIEWERSLPILATIGSNTPFLGLFGTVVRILLTFGEMSKMEGAANSSSQIMFGIGSALIATAGGLIVAIIAVVVNNFFTTKVSDWENHFKLLKLIFLSAAERRRGVKRGPEPANPAARGRRPAEI